MLYENTSLADCWFGLGCTAARGSRQQCLQELTGRLANWRQGLHWTVLGGRCGRLVSRSELQMCCWMCCSSRYIQGPHPRDWDPSEQFYRRWRFPERNELEICCFETNIRSLSRTLDVQERSRNLHIIWRTKRDTICLVITSIVGWIVTHTSECCLGRTSSLPSHLSSETYLPSMQRYPTNWKVSISSLPTFGIAILNSSAIA